MRYLVWHSADSFKVEADTPAEAARVVAVAIYGPHAQAMPERREARRVGGVFRLAWRAWDGSPLVGVREALVVTPMEARRREYPSAFPTRNLSACRTR